MANKRPSKRFTPSTWTERLVPIMLALLALALLATLLVVALSALGVTPETLLFPPTRETRQNLVDWGRVAAPINQILASSPPLRGGEGAGG